MFGVFSVEVEAQFYKATNVLCIAVIASVPLGDNRLPYLFYIANKSMLIIIIPFRVNYHISLIDIINLNFLTLFLFS